MVVILYLNFFCTVALEVNELFKLHSFSVDKK